MHPEAALNYTFTTQSANMGYNPIIILRKEAINKKGLAPINLQIFISGRRVLIPLDLHVNPKDFDEKRRRICGDGETISDINLLLKQAESKATQVILKCRLANIPLTPQIFKREYGDSSNKKSFTQFWKKELAYLKAEMNPGSYNHHKSVLEKLTSFRREVFFSELNVSFLDEFDRWMKLVRKNGTNTRATAMKRLHTYIRKAIRKGINITDPFTDFKITHKRTTVVALREDEVKQLYEIYYNGELSNALRKTLKCFLFMCHTGLRLSDAKRLNDSMIGGGEIILQPKKVSHLGIETRIPLTKEAANLLTVTRGRYFETHADQTMNKHLKIIAQLAGIHKHVTTKTGRKTFGTIYVERGGKIVALQKFYGHQRLDTTMVYVGVSSKMLRDEMNVMEGMGT